MNKDEILAKSRAENRNKDVYEYEILKLAHACAAKVVLILALVFFSVKFFTCGSMDWGVWALAFSVNTTRSWVEYIKLRRKLDLVFAIILTILVVLASGYHIYNLVVLSSSL